MAVTCTAGNLAALTTCFSEKLSRVESSAIRVVLLCGLVNGTSMNCDPESLSAAAKCFEMYSPQEHRAMRIVLLCSFLNNQTIACTPQALADASKCILEKLSSGDADSVETYLTCQAAAAGGGGSCANLSGAGSPVGVATPAFVGQDYLDTVSNLVWTSTGLVATNWVLKVTTGIYLTNNTGFDLSGEPYTTAITFLNSSYPNEINIHDNDSLESVYAPNLVTASDNFAINSLSNITSISFPKLATISGQFFSINSNGTGLVSLSFPALLNTGQSWLFNDNASLSDVFFGSVIIADGDQVDFQNCALTAASVNYILTRCVASGLSSSTIGLDGGTNSPPTGQGIIDAATLTANGCTVTTN